MGKLLNGVFGIETLLLLPDKHHRNSRLFPERTRRPQLTCNCAPNRCRVLITRMIAQQNQSMIWSTRQEHRITELKLLVYTCKRSSGQTMRRTRHCRRYQKLSTDWQT